MEARAAAFAEHRRMLFGIAYRMLGSVADAEDLVQDAWISWSQVTATVANPAGYLARTITNLSLNRLTSAAVRRESYVGSWLPEPLVTALPGLSGGPAAGASVGASVSAAALADVSASVELAESVSLAMLVVLESLSPLERAVFVLKEVFSFSYKEIAEALDRSEAAVRQVGSRARAHVQERNVRYDASAATQRQVTDEFLSACLGGDLNRMLELLAPDVTAWSDGGGKVRAALRPVHGADKVARFILGVLSTPLPDMGVHPVLVNGSPGLLISSGGRADSVSCLDVSQGRVAAIRIVRNPDKLTHVQLTSE
ncbi:MULTISPECIES: RNA polymerase sigma factor SigJ [unclassified Kitasatospora]|uniref:RNA polymerase sigma factor SigJ n=1 Tax=unclassified Kitasatospora TaxID=2633591 RepID=UPI00247629A3|nr:RNA polymerase sigma factor SigJ [Kitasatospora sp. MAP12-44]